MFEIGLVVEGAVDVRLKMIELLVFCWPAFVISSQVTAVQQARATKTSNLIADDAISEI